MHFVSSTCADKDASEISFSSPMPPVAPEKKTNRALFRRSTNGTSYTAISSSDNGANLSICSKQLHSGLSTYSVEDDNEQTLQSTISTDSEDPNFLPLGTCVLGYTGTESSLRVVDSFPEEATTNGEEANCRMYRSASLSVSHNNASNATMRNSVNDVSASRKLPTKSLSASHSHRHSVPVSTRRVSSHNPHQVNTESLPDGAHGNGLRTTARRTSPPRLPFTKRLSKDIELSKELGQCPPPPKPEPTLYAHEEESPVCLEFSGARCCPLLRRCVGKAAQTRSVGAKKQTTHATLSTEKEEDINLSPFKTWDFTRFLPQEGDACADTAPATAAATTGKNTLCLDLDETLVHTSLVHMADADAIVKVCPSETDGSGAYDLYVKYRPFLREFLEFSLKHYEVVIFTASKKYYAKAILARLQADYGNLFTFYAPDDEECTDAKKKAQLEQQKRAGNCMILLHRDHCTPTNAGFVKDLFLLGRDLRRCFIIDNNICCGSFQPYNFLHVKDFARREEMSQRTPTEADRATAIELSKNGGMNQAKLRELKGFRPSSDAGSLSIGESTYLWEDPDDTVLLQLISADHAILCSGNGSERKYSGLLVDLAASADIPKYLLDSMIKSKEKADKHPIQV